MGSSSSGVAVAGLRPARYINTKGQCHRQRPEFRSRSLGGITAPVKRPSRKDRDSAAFWGHFFAASLASPPNQRVTQGETCAILPHMPHDHHNHDHDHAHALLPPDPALRVRALETILTQKGLIDPAALDEIIDTYAHKVGPQEGARVIARAWADTEFRANLLENADSVLDGMGLTGRQGEHVIVVENTPERHNVIVCTLCSCYPWTLLGIPPAWYKSDAYRARVVREPRAVLADFGLTLPDGQSVRVWDSTAEVRYLVLPMRPANTEGWSAEQLLPLVTRDCMVGTGLPLSATAVP